MNPIQIVFSIVIISFCSSICAFTFPSSKTTNQITFSLLSFSPLSKIPLSKSSATLFQNPRAHRYSIKNDNKKTKLFMNNQGQNQQLGRVTMYKKEGCPYCQKAVELLEGKYNLNINFVDIESSNREEILQQMRTFSGGRNTVPQIFFNADHLGGNDDIQKLDADGLLEAKVATVRLNAVTMMQDHWFHPWY